MEPAIIILLGGILPFGSIFIEVLVVEEYHILFHLMHIIYTGILFLHLSGPTRFIMCMGLCYWYS